MSLTLKDVAGLCWNSCTKWRLQKVVSTTPKMKIMPSIATILPIIAVFSAHGLFTNPDFTLVLKKRLDDSATGNLLKSNRRQAQELPLGFRIYKKKPLTNEDPKEIEEEEEEIPEEIEYGEEEHKTPEVVVSSKKSYIGEFLSLYPPKNTPKEIKASVDSEHISPSKLVSTIDYTGDRISNPQNLRPYTELLNKKANQPVEKYKDVSYKKYGHKKALPKSSISYYYRNHLDMPSFIEYLKTQGFNINDLNFLSKPDLNYGFEEIERELDKIDNNPIKEPDANIIIGGEPVTNSGVHLIPKATLLILVLIALIGTF